VSQPAPHSSGQTEYQTVEPVHQPSETATGIETALESEKEAQIYKTKPFSYRTIVSMTNSQNSAFAKKPNHRNPKPQNKVSTTELHSFALTETGTVQ
jgi:hypothetical protein